MKQICFFFSMFFVATFCCAGNTQPIIAVSPTCFYCACKIYELHDIVQLSSKCGKNIKKMHRSCCFDLSKTYKDSYLQILPPGDQETIKKVRSYTRYIRLEKTVVAGFLLGMPLLASILVLTEQL